MARPPKKRYVKHRLSYQVFGPLDADADCREANGCVSLSIDQLEAMRLADLEGMSHNDAAEFMKISRQTFGRIIEQARQTVTLALINCKVLNIETDSNIEFIDREVKCIECGHEWMLKGPKAEGVVNCPECASGEIIKRSRCGSYCECPLKINKNK
jgi:predicted DNA-binding protein (UPF0251 family)